MKEHKHVVSFPRCVEGEDRAATLNKVAANRNIKTWIERTRTCVDVIMATPSSKGACHV